MSGPRRWCCRRTGTSSTTWSCVDDGAGDVDPCRARHRAGAGGLSRVDEVLDRRSRSTDVSSSYAVLSVIGGTDAGRRRGRCAWTTTRVERAGVAAGRAMGAWEALRVAAGRPRLGFETDHRTIPHEIGWLETAVHLDKGCYRGQETVARVHNLGRPPRRLVRCTWTARRTSCRRRTRRLLLDDRAVGFLGTARAARRARADRAGGDQAAGARRRAAGRRRHGRRRRTSSRGLGGRPSLACYCVIMAVHPSRRHDHARTLLERHDHGGQTRGSG